MNLDWMDSCRIWKTSENWAEEMNVNVKCFGLLYLYVDGFIFQPNGVMDLRLISGLESAFG